MSNLKELLYAIAEKDDPEIFNLLNVMNIDQINEYYSEKIGFPLGHSHEFSGTALHMACLTNNASAVSMLLNLKGINVNSRFKNDMSNAYCCSTSTWCGADISHFRGKDIRYYTPILVAAELKHKESFNLLVEDERVNLKATTDNFRKNGLAEMLQDLNVDNHDMLIKLLAAMRKQPTVKAVNIDMQKVTEFDVLKEHENNFGKLLDNGYLSDFKIICGDETFRCHKNILFTQSEVLKAMFHSEMKEYHDDSMIITDLEPAIVRLMIRFIYTGGIDVEEAKEKAPKLLEVADRYELKGLTKLCENELMSKINNDNVLEMIVKADLYHADKLREMAMKWIVANKFEIVKQEGWKQVLCKFPNLMTDMVDALTTKL